MTKTPKAKASKAKGQNAKSPKEQTLYEVLLSLPSLLLKMIRKLPLRWLKGGVSKLPKHQAALKAVVPILLIVIALGTFIALARTKPETRPRPVREKVWIVQTINVQITDHRPSLKLYGEAVAGRKIELRALVAGEIIKVAKTFREGGIVKAGDVLLKIDPFDFEASLTEAKANLKEARAKLDEIKARIQLETGQIEASKTELALAVRDHVRAKEIYQKNLGSQKAVDDRAFTVSQRRQALRQKTSNLAIEKARAAQQEAAIIKLKSQLRRAERDLRDTNVIAPFNAYVSALNAELGRMVGTNDTVATLIDTELIDIKFNFSSTQYGRILAGKRSITDRSLKVIWRIGESALSYDAKIERVGAQIAASSGGVSIYARLKDPHQNTPLRPGAFVEVLIDDRIFENVARLPETALYNGTRVFVINAKKRLASRKVKLIGYADNDILVRGSLKQGDKVVITRISQAKDGLLVRIK